MRAWCGRVYLCVSLCVAGVCHCVCVLAHLVAVLLVSLLPCLFACMLACMLSCWWTCPKFMRAFVFNPFACLLACFTHNLCARVVFGSVVHVAGLIVLLFSTIGVASTCVAQTQTRVRQFSSLQRPSKAPKVASPLLLCDLCRVHVCLLTSPLHLARCACFQKRQTPLVLFHSLCRPCACIHTVLEALQPVVAWMSPSVHRNGSRILLCLSQP